MPEYVRVKQAETGHEISIAAERVESLGAAVTVLKDKDAVDTAGVPLPPKYKTTVDQAAAKKATPAETTTKEK